MQENEKINQTENQNFVDTEKNAINEQSKQTNNTQDNPLIHRKSFAISIFLAIFFGIVIANIAGGYIGGLINGLLTCLTTFFSALVIIFVLKHVMAFIENKVLKKAFQKNRFEHQIKRIISIIVAFILLLLAIFLFMNLIIPKIVDIVTELVNNKDEYILQIKSQLTDFLGSAFNMEAEETVQSIMNSITTYLEDTFNNFLPQLLAISSSTIIIVGQICLGGILAFLYLLNREKINSFFAQVFKQKFKPATVDRTYDIIQRSDRVLLDYVVAKIIEAIVITVIIGIGLSILNVKYAFELALIVGILNVIPYIGFIIALVPLALITIIYGSIELAIQALIVTTIIYIILTTFITPVIVGKKIKINMLLMFSSMVIGGGMFGIIGMAVAPPIACIGAEIFKQRIAENAPKKQKSTNKTTASKKPKQTTKATTAKENKQTLETDLPQITESSSQENQQQTEKDTAHTTELKNEKSKTQKDN